MRSKVLLVCGISLCAHRVQRFVLLPFRAKLLLFESFCRLLAESIVMRILPVSRTIRLIAAPAVSNLSPCNRRLSIEDVSWGIETASRFVPGASCLVQSIVGRYMLQKAGYGAELRTGVAKVAGKFDAHAWVESDGAIVIGARQVPYSLLQPARSRPN